MEQQIITALLTGQRKVFYNGVEVELKPLRRDTLKNKEREAIKRAKEISKMLKSC